MYIFLIISTFKPKSSWNFAIWWLYELCQLSMSNLVTTAGRYRKVPTLFSFSFANLELMKAILPTCLQFLPAGTPQRGWEIQVFQMIVTYRKDCTYWLHCLELSNHSEKQRNFIRGTTHSSCITHRLRWTNFPRKSRCSVTIVMLISNV